MEQEIYTVAQAAEYLQICDKTVRRLISTNLLKASKVGNSWRIKKQDIDTYLNLNSNVKKGVANNE